MDACQHTVKMLRSSPASVAFTCSLKGRAMYPISRLPPTENPSTETVRIYGRDVPVHVAGKLDDIQPSGSIVALTNSRVAPGPAEIGREAWTTIDAEAWGDGWDHLMLSLS